MEEEKYGLISKKDILLKYGISYGALYRWKRMGLIPEEWFIRKSTVTGQETYFDEVKISERIEKIIGMKDNVSLENIGKKLTEQEIKKNLLRVEWKGGAKEIALNELLSVAVYNGDGKSISITEQIKKHIKG